jgi:hypothetical protein
MSIKDNQVVFASQSLNTKDAEKFFDALRRFIASYDDYDREDAESVKITYERIDK